MIAHFDLDNVEPIGVCLMGLCKLCLFLKRLGQSMLSDSFRKAGVERVGVVLDNSSLMLSDLHRTIS